LVGVLLGFEEYFGLGILHVDSDRASNNTYATFAQWLVDSMSNIRSTEGDVKEQSDASTCCIARAHSSLR